MSEQQGAQGSYYFDPESAAEMARLIEQDRMMTEAMGGPLHGLPDLPPDAQVVDLACGPGGWAIDAARIAPDAEIAGVDISHTMIDYANARARSQGIANASFGIMDITRPLDFSDQSFDLVNTRTIFGVLHQKAWRPFLAECYRILKPGGMLRLTEPVDVGTTNSVALERLLAAITQSIWKIGYGFSIDGRSFGITHMLPALLRAAGYRDVRTAGIVIDFSAGMPAWIDFYHNFDVAFQESKNRYINAGIMTAEEFEQVYQQAMMDMNQSDFCALATFVTVVGTKAPDMPDIQVS